MLRRPQQRKWMASVALALRGQRLEVGFCSRRKGARGARGNALVGDVAHRREGQSSGAAQGAHSVATESRAQDIEREESRELLLLLDSGRIRTRCVPANLGGGHRWRMVTAVSQCVVSRVHERQVRSVKRRLRLTSGPWLHLVISMIFNHSKFEI
jgi:hypothetical protein